MEPSYRKWTVRGYMRPVVEWTRDGVPFTAGHSVPVVVVFDPRGWQWEVTTEAGRITSLTIKGDNVDQAAVRLPPLGYLREVAETYAGEVASAVEAGAPLEAAMGGADSDPGGVRVHGDPPTPAEFAQAWRETPAAEVRAGARLTRRQALAQRYHVSVHSVDKWTRAARDAGLIPKAGTGRPRQDTPPSGAKKKETK